MLTGIDPLLTGKLLEHLDAMGHSDSVVIADAHFPAARIAARLIDLPGTSTPEVLAAVRSVLPLDDAPALDLMATPEGTPLPIHEALIAAAGAEPADVNFVDRYQFYDVSAGAYVIIRTGETRTYGNALLRKGLVQLEAAK